MIDTFSLLLMHGLIFLACWRLLGRDDLDREESGPATNILGRPRAPDGGQDMPGA